MNRGFPRLGAAQAKLAVSAFRERSLEQLRLGSRVLPDLTTERFAATGMQRMSATELKSLQEEIRQRMEEAGNRGGGVDRPDEGSAGKEGAGMGRMWWGPDP